MVASEEGVASRMPEARAAIQREFYRRMRGHGSSSRDASDYAECNAETAFLDPAAHDMRYAAAGDEVRVGGMAFQVNLPRFRLHPYAAFRAAPSRCLASNSAGLRFPSAEWILTLL